jgi:hypothetical protein
MFNVGAPRPVWGCDGISPLLLQQIPPRLQALHEFILAIDQGVHITDPPLPLSQTKEGPERVEDVQSSQKGVSTQLSAHQGPVQNLLGKSRAHNKQKPQKSLASKALLCGAERGLSEPFCGPDSSFHAEFYHPRGIRGEKPASGFDIVQ